MKADTSYFLSRKKFSKSITFKCINKIDDIHVIVLFNFRKQFKFEF